MPRIVHLVSSVLHESYIFIGFRGLTVSQFVCIFIIYLKN